jgi:arylsulfatase A-like enzyme
MQGRSFLNLLNGRAYQARTELFCERNWHNNFDPIRAIRTNRHKLIYTHLQKDAYAPISDLEASPTWATYVGLSRAGKLSAQHLAALTPTRPQFELYDLQQDPDELTNLATSSAHSEILQDLKSRLSDWMHETYDFLPPIYRNYPAGRGTNSGN